MKRSARWTWGASVALVGAAIGGFFMDKHRVIVGTLAGDAFFLSRPTRSWAEALHADPAEQAEALLELRQGGPAAVPVLTAILRDYSRPKDAALRWQATELLSKLGPDAAPAGAALVAATRDPDSHVRAVSTAALPKVGVPASIAVPVLTDLLTGEHGVVAARALSEYRSSAAPALSALRTTLQDPQNRTELRWNAARTIGKIGPAALDAVPDLMALLGGKEATIREHCAEAIGDIGPDVGPEAIAALTQALTDPYVRVRRDAVRSLGYIGPKAKSILPEVRKLLGDPEQLVRDATREALERIDSPLPEVSASAGDSVTSPK